LLGGAWTTLVSGFSSWVVPTMTYVMALLMCSLDHGDVCLRVLFLVRGAGA
jgi:hypothetical protein